MTRSFAIAQDFEFGQKCRQGSGKGDGWRRTCSAWGMNTRTRSLHVLDQFRQELYQHALTGRRDALFELLEAVLGAPGPCTLVRLSLSPLFARRWPSIPDALDAGALVPDQIRALIGAQ